MCFETRGKTKPKNITRIQRRIRIIWGYRREIKKGEPKLPLCVTNEGSMSLVLADVARTGKSGRIELDGQVTFRDLQIVSSDERECVAILELRLHDDVALESRGCRDTEVATARQREDQLATAGYA